MDEAQNTCEEKKGHSFVCRDYGIIQYMALQSCRDWFRNNLRHAFYLWIFIEHRRCRYMITAFTLDIHTVKEYLGTSIQIIDLFLVATVFYLISMGLYELFIAKAPLPGWVEIRNLDDLKTKLLGLTVIALAVVFLGYALTVSAGTSILELGAAVGIMIAAISAYLWVKH